VTGGRGIEVVVPHGPNASGRGYQRRAVQFMESCDDVVAVSSGRARSKADSARFVARNTGLPASVLAFQARWDFTPVSSAVPVFFTSRCVPPDFDGRFAIDFVDAIAAAYERRALATRPPQRWFWVRESRLLTAFDSDVLKRATASCAITQRDAFELGSDCRVIPMWANAEIEIDQLRLGVRRRLLFFGHLGFAPNAEAAAWCGRELRPHLHQDEEVVIAGLGGSRRTKSLPGYLGPYAELDDVIDSLTVAVVPVVLGSGLQTKVIEAASCGIPQVVTPFVAAGLASPLPRAIRVVDRSPQVFLAAARSLEATESDRQELRSWVRERYERSTIRPLWRSLAESCSQ
jgi:hypothetical protein